MDIELPHAVLPVCLCSSGPQQKSKRAREHLSVVRSKVWLGILSSAVTQKSCLGVPCTQRKRRVRFSPRHSPSHPQSAAWSVPAPEAHTRGHARRIATHAHGIRSTLWQDLLLS